MQYLPSLTGLLMHNFSLQIGCFATSGDKPIGVRWLKNNEPLYEQSGLIKITNLDSISLLEFTATKVKDQANYTCELSNYLGKDLFTTELIVTGMHWVISHFS